MSDIQNFDTPPIYDMKNLPFIELKPNKGINNLNIKIYQTNESIIFKIKNIYDFTEIIYSKEYKIKELNGIDGLHYFSSSKQIFNDFFKNFKEKEVIVLKKDYKIYLIFEFKLYGKIKKVEFILEPENININNIILLYDKIEEINNIKLKELNIKIDEFIKKYENKINNINNIVNEEKIKNNNNSKRINDIKEELKKINEDNLNKFNKTNKFNEKEKIHKTIKKIIIDYIIKNSFIFLFILLLNIYFWKSKNNFKNEINSINNKIDNEITILEKESINKINAINNIIDEEIKILKIYSKNEIKSINYKIDIINNRLDNENKMLKKESKKEINSFNNLNNENKMLKKESKKEINNINNLNKEIKNIVNQITDLIFGNYENYNKFENLTNEGSRRNFNKHIKNYKLLYKASIDGYDSEDFHNICDGISYTITLILTKDHQLFGGFTDQKWDKSNTFKKGDKGFIFSINNNEIYYNRNNDYNIYCSEKDGPIFGNFDIKISNNCNQNNYSYDGTDGNDRAYNTPGNEYVLAGKKNFYVLDYEVYQIIFE